MRRSGGPRQLCNSIRPAVLSNAGLRPALRALCRRTGVPVAVTVDVTRQLPQSVEVATYYVVAEGLTNIAKHACASLASVTVAADDVRINLSVADDGVGVADPSGSGLVGLRDRVEALSGGMDIVSPHHYGTILTAEIPV